MNKKISILISILVLATLAGGGFWLVKNQGEKKEGIANNQENNQEKVVIQDDKQEQVQSGQVQEKEDDIIARNLDVSKWKTYSNKEHGIEFKYPEEMFEIFEQVNGLPQNFSVTLNLFFNIDGNTIRTPIISIFFNDLEIFTQPEDNKKICKEISVGSKKGNICGTKNNFSNIFLNYESFVDKGGCVSGNEDQTIIISFQSRYIEKKKYTDGISIDLKCDHSESLGNIYKSIYKSIYFL